jgi:two-component system, OmpR family, sensor histidine kinase BaeS
MKNPSFVSHMSLKTKMILSYLLVILGTVIALTIAITAAAQNYFYNQQAQQLEGSTTFNAGQLASDYIKAGNTWGARYHINGFNSFFAFSDGNGVEQECVDTVGINPHEFDRSGNPNPCPSNASQTLIAIMHATLQTQQEQQGTVDLTDNDQTIHSLYTSIPIQVQNGTTIQTIGSVVITEQLSSLSSLLQQAYQAIILAGGGVALVAMLCSFLLISRFIRPLENLTRAAEQVKQGQYAQRVTPPNSQDELGRLALTFNEMADTIEADVNELRRQDALRRDLVANIAHDLATPLTAIQGFSEALADDVITDPNARQETAQRIAREVQRLRRMVAEIRQMSSLEAGQTKLDLAPLDIQSQVDETLAVIAPECENKGITVHNDIPTTMPPVLADSDRVTQVLLNLLDNARRHTPEGGEIHVGAQIYGASLSIWIQDTGTGIDAQDLPHIFERFYRADRSRTTTTGGSGLGLAIVKAIVTAHHGNVWAESTQGKGTRITFTLPLVPEPEQTPEQITMQKKSLLGKKQRLLSIGSASKIS